MQAPNWTDFLQCSICTSKFDPSDVVPISLSCGHTLCTRCLGKRKALTCPYDKVTILPSAEDFPPNAALLQLLGHKPNSTLGNAEVQKLSEADQSYYSRVNAAILELSSFLQPLAEHGVTAAITYLTKPMLKKLVTLINCQVLEGEGRVRAVRAARSIADRTVTELLVMHQNQQQLSTLLWTAVRNRGCQFLGPVMQEEALRLILKVMETGNFLSRKNIVLFVVGRLINDFPHASKTSVGHVVQLLYRASCFNVEKRDDDSSLMQLKEEFRTYECLRREHDAQIIRMAMEAGLRISPEQWSTQLYGDHKHKSDMQSIIDKQIAQGAASTGMSELAVAVGRSQDPYQLSEKVIPHLETIFKVPVNPDKTCDDLTWETFATVMEALLATLHGFTTFMQIQNGRFKTGMCPYLSRPGGCPKGERCTYAHSEEERDKFRSIARPPKFIKPRSGEQFSRPGGGRSKSGDHGPVKAHTDTHPSLNSLLMQQTHTSLPEQHLSDLMRYSGDQLSLNRPTSLTAPVLTNPDWHRNVTTIDSALNSFKPLSSEPLPPYAAVNQTVLNQAALTQAAMSQAAINQAAANQAAINQAALNQVAINQAAANQAAINQAAASQAAALSNKIDMLRLQHEAVNQSIDASAYPRELLPTLGAPATSYVEFSQRPDWPSSGQLNSDPFLSGSEPDFLGPSQQGGVAAQQLLSISGPSSNNSSGSYPSDIYPLALGTYSSESYPQTSSNSAMQAGPPAVTTSGTANDSVAVDNTTAARNSAIGGVVSVSSSSAEVSRITASAGSSVAGGETATNQTATVSSQHELQAEIERLREQLRAQQLLMKQQPQQQQKPAASRYGGVESAVIGRTVQPSTAISQHSTQLYLAAGGHKHSDPAAQQHPAVPNQQFSMVSSQHYSPSANPAQYPAALGTAQYPPAVGQYQATAVPQLYNNGVGGRDTTSQGANLLPSYPGTHYSTKQLQAAAMAAALVGTQQSGSSGSGYYPVAPGAAATPSYPWSGPQPGLNAGNQTTPPNSGFNMSTPLPLLPSSRQPSALVDSDDAMLATYIQIVEQSKAPGTTYPPPYNPPPPTPQYFYHH